VGDAQCALPRAPATARARSLRSARRPVRERHRVTSSSPQMQLDSVNRRLLAIASPGFAPTSPGRSVVAVNSRFDSHIDLTYRIGPSKSSPRTLVDSFVHYARSGPTIGPGCASTATRGEAAKSPGLVRKRAASAPGPVGAGDPSPALRGVTKIPTGSLLHTGRSCREYARAPRQRPRHETRPPSQKPTRDQVAPPRRPQPPSTRTRFTRATSDASGDAPTPSHRIVTTPAVILRPPRTDGSRRGHGAGSTGHPRVIG
jgi:hypothetical protein